MLAGHGLAPGPQTRPEVVRDALSDLYRYEIRRLKRRLLAGEFPKADYLDHVIELRRQYWLLSVPVVRWVRSRMNDFEKLGVFYLGRESDPSGTRLGDPVLYDSRHLVTHAVCVGMTGSGKTGLCLSLIEEAAIDGVPAIAIDPKGDLSNLLLTFPGLAPADFRPWIDEDEARRAGMSADAYAAQQAETWKKGLAEWGQDGARIERLRAAAEFAIYTPGSRAGLPLSILASFTAPPAAVRTIAEAAGGARVDDRHEPADAGRRRGGAARTRAHVPVHAARVQLEGRSGPGPGRSVIQQVQSPPFEKIGVLDVESFYPAKERFALASAAQRRARLARVRAVARRGAARPGPSALRRRRASRACRSSRSRISTTRERMFFVSLLLNEMVGWMRRQTGTSSLRAIVYMDEIAGYFPPVANPPSKAPLLTLLKQARAFGLGVVLATQNTVDLDYKGLGNAGTWFLGRLQTERDKARVLDGLEGASGGSLDREAADRTLSALAKRVFLLHDVHAGAPITFMSRWALSYLRGPLSKRADTNTHLLEVPPSERSGDWRNLAEARRSFTGREGGREGGTDERRTPVLPPDIPQVLRPRAAWRPLSSCRARRRARDLHGSEAEDQRDARRRGGGADHRRGRPRRLDGRRDPRRRGRRPGHVAGRGRHVRSGAESGRAQEELCGVAEGVRVVGDELADAGPPPSCGAEDDLGGGGVGARLQDPRPGRAARSARRGGRGRAAEVRREAGAARREGAPRRAGRAARAGAGHVDHRARRAEVEYRGFAVMLEDDGLGPLHVRIIEDVHRHADRADTGAEGHRGGQGLIIAAASRRAPGWRCR